MDPTTVLEYLAAMFGVSLAGLGAVVGVGARATRKRAALAEARAEAIRQASWEAWTIPLHDEWMRVQLVRVAHLGGARWIVDRRADYVDVPVEDTTALIDAQVDAQEAARVANRGTT